MKKFSVIDWRLRLLQLTVLLIPFSYQPRLYLSSLQGLNMEFSLVQIAGALFVALSIPAIFDNFKKLKSMLAIDLLAAFVALNWLSILWSADATRTVILSVYWSFLLAIVVAVVALFIDKRPKQREITNPLLLGAAASAAFGWFQFMGIVAGVSESVVLIKHAYNADLFGFVRIQAFALEPQFYANALIAPIAYLCWRVLFTKYEKYHVALLIWFFATFLLTVSRGGTLGMILALSTMTYFLIKAHEKDFRDRLMNLVFYLLVGLSVSIVAVYVSGTLQPNHTGPESVEIFIDQMSHGVIDIKLADGGAGVDGLVEASTTGRFYMVERALDLTKQAPRNYVIGIGAGSFGPVFQATFKEAAINNHVINNQYVEFFVELGIIGLALFAAFVCGFFRQVWLAGKPYNYLLIAIMLAFLVQYFFFSLQTNVLQIWLFVGVALGLSIRKTKVKS